MKNKSGVYEILNTVNGKRYIGQTINFVERWKKHRLQLICSKHHSPVLQRAWNKYGEEAFKFRIVLTCAPTKEMLCFYEQQLLDKAKPEYNICTVAGSALGVKRTAETKALMSAVAKRRGVLPETLAKMQAARRGLPMPAVTRAALASANKGHKRSYGNKNALGFKHAPEVCARMSAAQKGKILPPQTAEQRAKNSLAQRGRVFSADTRAKMSEAAKKRVVSAETRAKLAATFRGKPRSSEFKAALSARMVQWHAMRKAAQLQVPQ